MIKKTVRKKTTEPEEKIIQIEIVGHEKTWPYESTWSIVALTNEGKVWVKGNRNFKWELHS